MSSYIASETTARRTVKLLRKLGLAVPRTPLVPHTALLSFYPRPRIDLSDLERLSPCSAAESGTSGGWNWSAVVLHRTDNLAGDPGIHVLAFWQNRHFVSRRLHLIICHDSYVVRPDHFLNYPFAKVAFFLRSGYRSWTEQAKLSINNLDSPEYERIFTEYGVIAIALEATLSGTDRADNYFALAREGWSHRQICDLPHWSAVGDPREWMDAGVDLCINAMRLQSVVTRHGGIDAITPYRDVIRLFQETPLGSQDTVEYIDSILSTGTPPNEYLHLFEVVLRTPVDGMHNSITAALNGGYRLLMTQGQFLTQFAADGGVGNYAGLLWKAGYDSEEIRLIILRRQQLPTVEALKVCAALRAPHL